MASNTNMKADDVISRGSIVDISRRWLLLAYLAGVNWCTHYILALMCRFYASKQFCCPGTRAPALPVCMLSGYPGTRITRVLVPEETGTRPRVRVVDLKSPV